MVDQKTSGQSVTWTSRPKRAALYHVRVDHGRADIGAQTVMLHPNNPADSTEEFFSHDGNLSGINTIRPNTSRLGHRRKRRFRVGKTDEYCQKIPYIPSNPDRLIRKTRNLSGYVGAESVIKEQIVLLFDKDSTCHILSSWAARGGDV